MHAMGVRNQQWFVLAPSLFENRYFYMSGAGRKPCLFYGYYYSMHVATRPSIHEAAHLPAAPPFPSFAETKKLRCNHERTNHLISKSQVSTFAILAVISDEVF